MPTVTSPDGITIDYDIKGQGPVLVFVAGALQHRDVDETTSAMADDLADRSLLSITTGEAVASPHIIRPTRRRRKSRT